MLLNHNLLFTKAKPKPSPLKLDIHAVGLCYLTLNLRTGVYYDVELYSQDIQILYDDFLSIKDWVVELELPSYFYNLNNVKEEYHRLYIVDPYKDSSASAFEA